MTSDRLSVIDDILLRTHRGYGLPIVLQGVWRCDEGVDRVELAAVHANLAVGTLGRRVVAPTIPGARRRWTTSTDSLPLSFDETPLATSDILDWADLQGEHDLDPEFGPGWRLSARPTETGGTVVSLVCSHALTDAAGLIAAAGRAFDGSAPVHHVSRRRSDVVDALALLGSVTKASLGATTRLWWSRQARADLREFVRASSSHETHDASISTAVFDLDGSLSNSEFISLVVELVAALGHPDPIAINVPFRSAASGANGIGMATVSVSRFDTTATIKSACKAAFTKPAGAPSGYPAEAVQLLPDHTAAKLTSAPGAAAVLCSNIGVIPRSVVALGSHPATTLATRALHPRAAGSRTSTSLSAYISTMGECSTLSLVGTDAELIPSAQVLADRTREVLAGRGLTAGSWR